MDVFGEKIEFKDDGYNVSDDGHVHLIVNINWKDGRGFIMYCLGIPARDIKNLLFVLDSEEKEKVLSYNVVHLSSVQNHPNPPYKRLELDTIDADVFSNTDFLHDLVTHHMGFRLDRYQKIHSFSGGYLSRETRDL